MVFSDVIIIFTHRYNACSEGHSRRNGHLFPAEFNPFGQQTFFFAFICSRWFCLYLSTRWCTCHFFYPYFSVVLSSVDRHICRNRPCRGRQNADVFVGYVDKATKRASDDYNPGYIYNIAWAKTCWQYPCRLPYEGSRSLCLVLSEAKSRLPFFLCWFRGVVYRFDGSNRWLASKRIKQSQDLSYFMLSQMDASVLVLSNVAQTMRLDQTTCVVWTEGLMAL